MRLRKMTMLVCMTIGLYNTAFAADSYTTETTTTDTSSTVNTPSASSTTTSVTSGTSTMTDTTIDSTTDMTGDTTTTIDRTSKVGIETGRMPITIQMYAFDSAGNLSKSIGTIQAEDTPKGLMLTADLTKLPAGAHGFHLHENASCGNHGKEAGEHVDKNKTGIHNGPVKSGGHNGDLPYLIANDKGVVDPQHPVIAPNLRVADLIGHSLVIHAGGDNYSDSPNPMGGGGARIACGIVK